MRTLEGQRVSPRCRRRHHEFIIGPAADVAADKEGTPEIADIRMMATKSLTFTFSGSGPFAFACHAPGHYEAALRSRARAKNDARPLAGHTESTVGWPWRVMREASSALTNLAIGSSARDGTNVNPSG